MRTYERGTASCRLNFRRDGLAVAEFRGLMLPGSIVLGGIAGQVAYEQNAGGVLFRADTALIAFSERHVPSPGALPAGARSIPAAIVVAPCDVQLFQRYNAQAVKRGVIRAIFTDLLSAELWLEAEARALRETMALRNGQRSASSQGTRYGNLRDPLSSPARAPRAGRTGSSAAGEPTPLPP